LLARSGWVTGGKAIQNRGTIGGNIANASPAADTPPSLLAYGVQIELLSQKGTRQIPYLGFHLDYKKMQLLPGEIISAVLVPRNQKWTHHYYRKVGTRAFQSISKVAVSAAARIENGVVQEIQVGFASIAAIPDPALELRKSLFQAKIAQVNSDKIAQEFVKNLNPLTDIRSTAEYRKVVVERVTSHLIDVLKGPPGIYLES
jgi:xanthine dehydrogenase iron-sulfur cluster and FAD-binding subunit A